MGRLFWKLFAALFLAFFSTGMLVGSVVSWQHHLPRWIAASYHSALSTSSCTTPPCSNGLSATDTLAPPSLSSQPTSPPPSTDVPALTSLEGSTVGWLSPLAYGVTFGLSLLFAGLLAWAISQPVRLMLGHLKSAAETTVVTPVRPMLSASHYEFTELGEAYDAIALRLQNMVKSQSNMLHHVSHELRSPLARIQMAVGLVMQNPKKLPTAIERIELEALRMDRMIAELLEIFRFESGMHTLQQTAVNLNSLLSVIVSDVQFEREEAKLRLALPDAMVWVNGQGELLQRAIENVVRNALKYGPQGGIVSIGLYLNPRTAEAVLEIEDQGKGVPDDELEHIFKPFVRGSHTAMIEGHGIGLALTKHIIEAHGGFIKAVNLHPTGFMLRIHLPVRPAVADSSVADNQA